MANKKITDLAELTTVADGDKIYVVDVSDTTDSSDGTSKFITKENLVTIINSVFDSLSITEGTTDANALNFGDDCNLYRESANALRTDDQLTVNLDITTVQKFKSFTAGTTGEIQLSSSNGAYDVNLYAGASNVLKTDDSLSISGGSLEVGSNDATAGEITLFGAGTGTAEGAQINMSLSADHDGTFESWILDAYEDDLRIFTSNAAVVNSFTAEGKLKLPKQGSAGGILLGEDVNLYRSAQNLLTTDDAFSVNGEMTAGSDIKIFNSTSKINFSDNGVVDTNLYRGAADTLKTDDSLIVDADLTVNGTTTDLNTALDVDGVASIATGTSTTAGGAAAISVGASSALGIYFGSGAPTTSAPKGSLYMRTDGSGTSDRMYVNTDSSTTWTSVTTAA